MASGSFTQMSKTPQMMAGAPLPRARFVPTKFNSSHALQSSFAGTKMNITAENRSMSRGGELVVHAVRDGATLDRPLRVAVVGGGPSGACTAETLAKGGCETYLIERKLDNAKVMQHAR